MKTLGKVFIWISLTLATIAGTMLISFFMLTSGVKLNESKLKNATQMVTITDENGEKIMNTTVGDNKSYVSLSKLSDDTIHAFLASEDAKFYSHHGLNYKRMVKALWSNITSQSFKEGASTISQQLIKNTHLSSDKTIARKLSEIRLTKQLERKYSKNDILEMYLNTIYFGHNCYGLESAAEFYFDTSAENLTLEQSTTLVGLLSSPNNYSPYKNAEKSLQRRNLVLKRMKSCGFIDEETYQTESKKELSCTTTKNKNEYSDYVWAVFNELEELQIDPYTLKEGCVVQTYCNKELQKTIASYTFPCDHAVLVSDTQTAGIQAFLSTNQNGRRQPGSAIKPLLVYAPAIDKNLITPYTKILDEPIRYGTYAPENYDKKYHGKVSVSTALAQSYNVPAVKILNQLTLKTAEDYAKKMQIPLDSTDKNLALALGGMNYGTTLQELCDGYTVFANGGNYQKSRFIKKITDKNQNVLYEASHKTTRVFEEGTASLLNEMLIETAKIGTAKKLKDLPFQIAAKTGTNGNSEGNLDAYTIGYTSQNTVGIWLGDNENKRLEVKGSDCCKYVKDIMQTLYLPNSNNENNQSTQKNTTNQNEETSRLKLNNHLPPCLETHKGTKEIMIDKEEFKQNDKMVLCDEICPFKNKLTIKVKSGTEPTTQSTKFQHPTIQNPQITVKDNKIILLLYQTEYYAYLINRQNNEEIVLIYDGNWQKEITDEPPCGTYSYTITPYYSYQGQNYYGETLTLPPVNLSNSNSENSSPQKIPDILSHDWFQE